MAAPTDARATLLDQAAILDAAGVPRIEILARHGTDWEAAPGQFPHPHPHLSPNGKYVAFNTAAVGRADVCLLSL